MSIFPILAHARRLAFVLPIGALAGAGCSYSYDQNFFDYDREQSRTRRMFEAQYAKAAAAEATLFPGHFDLATDGPRLNGLGRERLDRMLAARTPGVAVKVAIDPAVGADAEQAEAMARAARDYLAASGLEGDAFAVAVRPSPAQTPSEGSLAALANSDETTAGGTSKKQATSTADLTGLFGGSR